MRISVVRKSCPRPKENPNHDRKGNFLPMASKIVCAFANPCMSKMGLLSSVQKKKHVSSDFQHAPTDSSVASTIEQVTSRSSANSLTSAETSDNEESSSDDGSMSQSTVKGENDTKSPSDVPQICDTTPDDSSPKPPHSCDLIVMIEAEHFFYSSDILNRHSKYLNNKSVRRDPDGRYYLDFPYHSAEEWRPFVGFIQSHLVRASELSWNIFPSILPWFIELQMEAMLLDSDAFLVNTINGYQVNEQEDENVMSVTNVLLVANIAFSHGFESTKIRSQQWLKAKLQGPQEQLHNSDHRKLHDDEELTLQWSLEDLQLLSELLLNFEALRNFLWESSIIQYLPHDLNVCDPKKLVVNILFPYLLREGMIQILVQANDSTTMTSDEQSKRSCRSSSPTTEADSKLPIDDVARVAESGLTQDILKNYLQTTVENLDRFHKIKEKVKREAYQRRKEKVLSRERERRSRVHVADKKSRNCNQIALHDVASDVDHYVSECHVMQPFLIKKKFAC